jgi:4-alpha-glucanotransferase
MLALYPQPRLRNFGDSLVWATTWNEEGSSPVAARNRLHRLQLQNESTVETLDQELLRQAETAGIETSFVDTDGVERRAEEPGLRLLVDLLTRPAGGDKVLVVRHGDSLDLRAGNGSAQPVLTTLCKHDHVLARSTQTQLALPDDLPRGDYRLDLALEDGQRQSFCLLHTPSRAYQPAFALKGRKNWVLSVQLYSLCNARNFGHGDFTDLRALLELVAEAGGAGVGVNPLHALAEDNPDEPSPYAPSSRIFLNWLYIDVGSLPFVGADEVESHKAHCSPDDGSIDYAGAATTKEKVLRLSWQRFQDQASESERQEFAAFQRRLGPDLQRYACFCLLRRREGGSWRYWRQPWAQPDPQDIDALAREHADEIGFHQFVQFQAHSQLARCKAVAQNRAMDIGLYLDVAVGVHPDGFDAWNDPDAFLQGASIGAPPDPLNKAGQSWGLTSFHPAVLRQRGFLPFRQMLGAAMQYAGAIRIDHVLGLNRLYVIPPGAEATQGIYVKYPLQDLLAVTAMESQFHRCLVIGEDLGTVPEGLRDRLRDFGIWTYRVMIFERNDSGFLPPDSYPKSALATFSTHDLPTFAGWIAGKDIETAHRLGLLAAESDHLRANAVRELARLVRKNSDRAELQFNDIVTFLSRTPSQLVSFALEDLLGSTVQINIPGTHREYPNWRLQVKFGHASVKAGLQQLAFVFNRRELSP